MKGEGIPEYLKIEESRQKRVARYRLDGEVKSRYWEEEEKNVDYVREKERTRERCIIWEHGKDA